ncbi:MAG: hypothetical protein A3H97_00890 [Acidobacteria bacterium RIFCSPLOWO2_02_FULL_65_29]|nr:MAG: hypothetical protein A3H97_00890 [Acidobacteria bacterium RIFCSPLOWO2_02_FULL_65_29]
MNEIRAAQISAFYLFDVAETVDLAAIPALIGGPTVAARLAPKPATPAYVQYDKPPVSFDGEAVGIGEIDGFRARFRLYDYGVISIALTRPFSGDWPELVTLGQSLIENDELEARAAGLCRSTADRLRPALKGFRTTDLSEDYLVYAITELDRPQTADELLAARGGDIAAMLRGERQRLSDQERETILGRRISYLADDLVVPTWNAAFVYDTPAGAQAALEILEFANSQLLEFRYYDERLDNELAAIYAGLQRPGWYDQWVGSRYARAARGVHALIIEVQELTDRTENALKFTGDIYAARLFRLVGERLGLSSWKADVEAKLKTLGDIYHFTVEQSSMARGQFLELTIVLILVLELVLIFLGVMQ